MFVPPESLSALLAIISSKSACNRSHARRVNSGKIPTSYGVPLFDAFIRHSRGIYSPTVARHLVAEKQTRNSTLSYDENPESLPHLDLVRYEVVTDRQTDGSWRIRILRISRIKKSQIFTNFKRRNEFVLHF